MLQKIRMNKMIAHFDEMKRHRKLSAQILLAYWLRKFIKKMRRNVYVQILKRVDQINYHHKICMI